MPAGAVTRVLRAVMPALGAGIHVFMREGRKQGVDGRDKPGHDDRNHAPPNSFLILSPCSPSAGTAP